jgi:holo-[acyl-carrier protein] synthase
VIVGIGVDVVDLARFERAVTRTPRLADRLFAESERRTAAGERPLRSLAGRFAAKEALVKALGGDHDLAFLDMRIVSDASGAPTFDTDPHAAPALAAVLTRRGVDRVHLSLAHDGGVAVAYVVAEASGAPAANAGAV